jgi:hypothetical protein
VTVTKPDYTDPLMDAIGSADCHCEPGDGTCADWPNLLERHRAIGEAVRTRILAAPRVVATLVGDNAGVGDGGYRVIGELITPDDPEATGVFVLAKGTVYRLKADAGYVVSVRPAPAGAEDVAPSVPA